MAEKKSFAGNKMSLRSGPGEQIHRISWLANNMHGLGDVLVSTQMSALAALGIGAVPLIILVFVFLMSNGAKNIGHLWLPVILVITGAVLLALNIVFVNPSQGWQFKISFQYWHRLLANNQKGVVNHCMDYRFVKQDAEKASLESVDTIHHQRRYLAVIKVHGGVSPTSFDADLNRLCQLNYASIRALERSTVRTTVNAVGRPEIKPKILAKNSTPAMRRRQEEISRANRSGASQMQTLDTYIMLDAPSWSELQKKVANQFTFYRQGLVVTAQVLSGDKLKETVQTLFA